MTDRRRSGVRRDFNDLVRDESGKISGSKIGTYAGQGLAGWLLYTNAVALIEHWEALAMIFTVLIAPELAKKRMTMKYSANEPDRPEGVTVTTKTSVAP